MFALTKYGGLFLEDTNYECVTEVTLVVFNCESVIVRYLTTT